MAKFLNTTEIAEVVGVSNKTVIRHAEKLGMEPVGRIENKPSSHKSGKVWKAKQMRTLKRHFAKSA